MFPGLGNLAGFLCTVDCTSRVMWCLPPTLDDIEYIICRINAGGTKRLIALGLLPVGARHLYNDIRDAFVIYHDFLNHHLTDEEKNTMDFDYLMCENLLCKIRQYFNRIGSYILIWDDYVPYLLVLTIWSRYCPLLYVLSSSLSSSCVIPLVVSGNSTITGTRE